MEERTRTDLLQEDLIKAQHSVLSIKAQLHDAVNELCQKCGRYQREHEGACNGCKWLPERRGW